MKKPEITVYAGPNGSGKSTITLSSFSYAYINADNIKKILNCSDMEAAKKAEAERENLLLLNQDFAFETVLSTERNLSLLRKAKEKGYFVRGFYVLTIDPLINVARVYSRVAAGGHPVPEKKIIERYDRSTKNVPEFVNTCDVCHIYDNSGDIPFRIFKKRKEKNFYEESEDWNLAAIKNLVNVDRMEYKILNKIIEKW